MDEEKIILKVEHSIILYDTAHLFYEDTSRKEKVWNEAAEVLGVPIKSNSSGNMWFSCELISNYDAVI